MTRYAAFVRAINVRGHPPLKMDVARRAFIRAGAENVTTFLQSGNILFDAHPPMRLLFARIRRELAKVTQGEPAVMFRKVSDLRKLLATAPFSAHEHDRTLKLYAVFLERKLRQPPPLPIRDAGEALDLIGIDGAHALVVSRPKPGKRFYGMPNAFVERVCGQRATSRYWSTLARLVAKA